jgi:hypothetical protein
MLDQSVADSPELSIYRLWKELCSYSFLLKKNCAKLHLGPTPKHTEPSVADAEEDSLSLSLTLWLLET